MKLLTCDCPMSRAGMIEHRGICVVVLELRRAIDLHIVEVDMRSRRVVNLHRRRIRSAKRRAGKQAAA